MKGPRRLTKSTFKKHTGGNALSVVKFGAKWCGPCRDYVSIFSKLSEKYGDAVAFFDVDVDKEPALEKELNICAIPTVIFVINGEVVDSLTGLQTLETVSQKIESLK